MVSETLLSPSNILLFGRIMDDLIIVEPTEVPTGAIRVPLATTSENIAPGAAIPPRIDGRRTDRRDIFLLKNQANQIQNGVYKRNGANISANKEAYAGDVSVFVRNGVTNSGKVFTVTAAGVVTISDGDSRHNPFGGKRLGFVSEIEEQIQSDRDPSFARIYGVSFEGYYYDLPRPVVFLVHGDGTPASENRAQINRARAPANPSLTGIGQADFQFSDDIMVWSYDKADYTIRMDVATGMFEDVLLGAMLSGGAGGMDAAGMSARGMSARGMSARGMSARGMSARGGGNNGD